MANLAVSWSIRDADNAVVLDVQTDGTNFQLSATEENENGHIIDLSATRDQMRQFANWILQSIS